MARPDRHQRETIAIAAVSLAVCMGLISIGGIYAWGVYSALIASVLGLAFFSIDRFGRHGSIRVQLPFWTAIVLAVLSLVQAIPLPTGVMRVLSPEIYKKIKTIYDLTGLSFNFHTIALNADSAMFSVNKFLTAGAIFLLTMNLAHKHRRGVRLAAMLVIIGVALLLIALFDMVLTPGTVLGLYSPSIHNRPWMVSLLISPNNLSAVLNLTGFTAMGLYIRSQRKTGYLVAAIILEAGAFMTLSRAGIAGAVVGIVLFLIMGLSGLKRRLSVWILLPVLLAAFFVFVLAFDRSTTEIVTGTGLVKSIQARLALAVSGLNAFIAAPFTGIGQLGFGDFHRIFGGPNQWATFFFVENEPVQYLTDFGVFGLFAILIFIIWFVHTMLIAKKDGPTTGLSIGLTVLFLQGLVDFNPEMPGVLFMIAMAIGTLYGLGTQGSFKREGRFFHDFQAGRVWLTIMVIISLTVGSLVFILGPRKMVEPASGLNRATGVQAFIMSRLPTEAFVMGSPPETMLTEYGRQKAVKTMTRSLVYGRLKKVMDNHPLNPRAYMDAASAMMVSGDTDSAINLARAANLLAPHSIRYRLFLTDILTTAGKYQAAANQVRPLLANKVSMAEVVNFLGTGFDGLKTAAYLGNDYGFVKNMMSFIYYHKKGRREGFCRMVLDVFPKNCVCRGFLIREYVNRNGDTKKAEMAATMLLGECPNEPDGYLTLGDVMLRQGKKTEAYYMLLEARRKLGSNLSFDNLLQIAALQIDLGHFDEAHKTIARVRLKGRSYKWVNVRARLLEIRILLKKGKISGALLEAEAVVREAPADIYALNAVLHIYLKIGNLRKALDIIHRMYKLTGNEKYKKQDAAIRKRIQMDILQNKGGNL